MEALKDLLSSLLAMDPDRIQRIEILNPMQYNDSYETKETILDLKIHLNNESFILVEIQVREFKYWTNRTLIYACPPDNGSDQRKRRLSEAAAGGTDCDYEIFPVPGTQKVLYGV